MTGLEVYLLVSPFILLAVAGVTTWLLVGRKNAPLGAKANKISLRAPTFQTISVPSPPSAWTEGKPTHEAPPLHQ